MKLREYAELAGTKCFGTTRYNWNLVTPNTDPTRMSKNQSIQLPYYGFTGLAVLTLLAKSENWVCVGVATTTTQDVSYLLTREVEGAS